MRKTIYVDFENVPNVEIRETSDTRILIFIGQSQKRLSTNIVRAIQPLGKNVEWIQINGSGKNALDFHIAYYLAMHKAQPDMEHYIISKDAGFDPLIVHANGLGQKVRRVVSFADVFEKIGLGRELEGKYKKVKEILMKQQKTRRPKSRKTLTSFIETTFQKKISTAETNKLIENLFRDGIMEEKSKRISYLD
ncbi:MAG: PIN domain-containing protein [Spirochaetia bacterium]